ncbi:MAG: DsbA family oxidoreductase [Nocardiopsis sp. BM-2018]|uniref:Putative DsbA family dithiol-disulfide isomerase n=1 Tax=Nocardiopsis metallicus TaxID=179819 RepID=A0A840W7D4_9ACTN|nr:DsbA family protein [Nocardiopsis metallicus]MBB5492920.1 putative DsbA family dithiol-disulfide isomerase [Nocardiopsis metallicus]QRN80796.1 MAG: DsbA family oxidoreductase [Nocardiopsis sp. BM-2018]
MRIEIWADVVCPWMYIGKRRLERALAERSGEPVEVVWRPYRVDPTAPAVSEPVEEFLRDPFVEVAPEACGPVRDGDGELVQMSELAAAEGLGDRWGAAWRADSHDAHRLLALAAAEGPAVQDAVAEGVLRAHFVEGRDIADPGVLAGIATEAGFARGGELLAGGGGAELVRELLLWGQAEGVRTSPTFVANGMALTGAQPPELIAEFLDEAAGREPRRIPEEVERLRRAEALLELANPLGALELLGPLTETYAADRGVRFLAARAYYRSAQLNRARSTLEALLEESADDAYAHLLLGRTLQRQGERELAEPHLRLAAVMDPSLA